MFRLNGLLLFCGRIRVARASQAWNQGGALASNMASSSASIARSLYRRRCCAGGALQAQRIELAGRDPDAVQGPIQRTRRAAARCCGCSCSQRSIRPVGLHVEVRRRTRWMRGQKMKQTDFLPGNSSNKHVICRTTLRKEEKRVDLRLFCSETTPKALLHVYDPEARASSLPALLSSSPLCLYPPTVPLTCPSLA